MSYGYKTSLKLDGVSHDVNVVSYAFDKSINETGKATSPAQGGKIFLSLADMPKKNILKWGIESRSTTAFKSGIIETIGIDTGSPIAEEEIAFEYAACVNLKLLYERDRSNYFTTLLTISAKKMCIGRSNCWVNKENWVIENDGAEHNSNILDEIKESVSKDAVIEGFLYVMGKKYEIQAFETEFTQPDDWKGQPQNEVKGGLLLITLNQRSDEVLINWMFKEGVSYNGLITFAPVSRMECIPLTIEFEEGRCISYEKMIGVHNGIQLSLLISSEIIHVEEIKHENK